MFKKAILLLLLIATFSNSYSQLNSESERKFFPNTYGEKKWRFFFDFDSRRSFFTGQQIKINGIRLGATYNGVNRFGLGLYALSDKINIDGIKVKETDAIQPAQVRVTFNFTTLFFEKVLYKTKRWEVAIPTYFGIGSVNPEYKNNLGNFKSLKKTSFNVLSLGVNVNYYVLSWLYPRLMLGYRFAFNGNEKVDKAFSKPFFAFGIGIDPWEAYLEFKSWKKKKKD